MMLGDGFFRQQNRLSIFSRPVVFRLSFSTGLEKTIHSSKRIMQPLEIIRKFFFGSTLFSRIVLKNHLKRKPLAKPITVQIN
jgi:hypothetical protein